MQLLHYNYILGFSVIFALTLFSCRKKDERYEGTYVGTERYTYLDSGETEYSIDTSYVQEIEVSYSKKFYTFLKQYNPPNQVFSISKKEIVDNEYVNMYDGSSLKFEGDSMFIYAPSFSDYIINYDFEEWIFKGKRN